ncbi:DNA-3-methyladenine glycosylase [Pontibacillus halophilus JSM 076056 = DSM 19796]|uniref:DNA-3-methyladenine glycosylase II n=1 Tax=Pontibacillus halophilus JSM 076056 = DSM 19796 TaxID=1385510 RepID=A0A0A5GP15_9BACI|nr:DNA-3-methyladenine glycosylase [Pontibacillus halophilus]KGX92973.1 DNA-3-methyladenine glycosylase [Pontibacillus halophilus JSM 076056 = DSM 19796]
MWKEVVRAAGSYAFDHVLVRLEMDPIITVNQEERWIDVPVRIGESRNVVRVQGTGTTENPEFVVSSKNDEEKDLLLHRIQDLFQWDVDLDQIKQHFRKTNLSTLFNDYPGTPIVKDFHLYDCLMKVIIHQQLNMKFAYTLSSRFVQTFGELVDGVWFYPTPERVARLEYEQLRELQFSQRKAEYVIDTSRKIADGELDLAQLSTLTDDEAMKELTKIRGIGPWTVENWLMFGLGRTDLYPKADIGVQNALKRYFQMDRKPTKEEMVEMSDDWDPYKSYASITLWRSIEG